MELHKILIRVAVTYVFMMLMLRLSGKRTLAQGAPFDFVLAIMAGDLVEDLIWAEVTAAKFFVAVGVLFLTQVLTSVLCYFSDTASRIIEGKPRLVVADGRLNRGAMRSEAMNEKEIAEMLRHRGIDRDEWNKIEHAWLEEDGQLSLFEKPNVRDAKDTEGTGESKKGPL
jgi:uncharacterized membrane protein YcaP (DUF421 family)